MLLSASGCSSLVIKPALESLNTSLEQQTDLNLVREGAPALLLLIDGLITSDPDNRKLLIAGTKSYSAYAALLSESGETERAAAVSGKAKDYGLTLLYLHPKFSEAASRSLTGFSQALSCFTKNDLPSLFWAGYGWGTWIKFQNGAPAAMADLPKVEMIMQQVLELDESFYHGSAHAFLGSSYGSRPKIYGGKPEESRSHFERALELGKRHFLLVQVAYADTYARTNFDRELFETLLKEVLATPLAKDELASSNQLAKTMARRLLGQIDDFF